MAAVMIVELTTLAKFTCQRFRFRFEST